jgi:transcription elongation factor SPT6
VRVSNESYFLFDTQVPTVPSLCDAFKYRLVRVSVTYLAGLIIRFRHMHESQNPSGAGGKTPYGGRTPARTPAAGRTPGHTTPGHHSVRVPPPSTYQPPAPQSYPYGQTPYGGYPPSGPPGGMPPPPSSVMLQKTSGWGQSSNW